MPFDYTPVSDEQLEKEANDRIEANLLPEGEYDFEVTIGTNHISQAGKESIKIVMMVFKKTDGFVTVTDYLTPAYMSKFKHAAQACGLEAEYNAGTLDGDMFSGRTGKLTLTRQGAQNGYGPKNVVKDYSVVKGATRQSVKAPVANEFPLDDEIPF